MSPLQYKVYSRIRGEKQLLIASTRHIGDAEMIAESEVSTLVESGDRATVWVQQFNRRVLVWKTGE